MATDQQEVPKGWNKKKTSKRRSDKTFPANKNKRSKRVRKQKQQNETKQRRQNAPEPQLRRRIRGLHTKKRNNSTKPWTKVKGSKWPRLKGTTFFTFEYPLWANATGIRRVANLGGTTLPTHFYQRRIAVKITRLRGTGTWRTQTNSASRPKSN